MSKPQLSDKDVEAVLEEVRRALRHYREVSGESTVLGCEAVSQLPPLEAQAFLAYQLAHLSQLAKAICEFVGMEDKMDSFVEPRDIPDTKDN